MSKLRETLNNQGQFMWRINLKTRTSYYKLRPDVSQFKYCERINLKGFDRLPSGLYKAGFGITASGSFLLQEFVDKFQKKVELTLIATGSPKIDDKRGKILISIPVSEL